MSLSNPNGGFLTFNVSSFESSKLPVPSFLLSVPAVCCYRRATSSQRHSTTISWPLGAGQLWLVSTALLFYWQSPALVVVAVLCPGNSEHRLWLCGGRGIGGKGQWVYYWIQHSTQLAFKTKPCQQIKQLRDVIYYESRPWHSHFVLFLLRSLRLLLSLSCQCVSPSSSLITLPLLPTRICRNFPAFPGIKFSVQCHLQQLHTLISTNRSQSHLIMQ